MWPCRLVVGQPATDDLSSMNTAKEQRLAQDLAPRLLPDKQVQLPFPVRRAVKLTHGLLADQEDHVVRAKTS